VLHTKAVHSMSGQVTAFDMADPQAIVSPAAHPMAQCCRSSRCTNDLVVHTLNKRRRPLPHLWPMRSSCRKVHTG
jgi:hypothetical protein